MKYKNGDKVYYWDGDEPVLVQIENTLFNEKGDYLIYSKDPYVYCYCMIGRLFDTSQECFDATFPVVLKKTEKEIKILMESIEKIKKTIAKIKKTKEWKVYAGKKRIKTLTN
jgi:hypothetical protein